MDKMMMMFSPENKENDAKSHEDKFKKSSAESSQIKTPPKIRRSVLKEFDPLATESPYVDKTTKIDEEEEIFEDAETSLRNSVIHKSVEYTTRESILIPELQEYRPNLVNLNDTEDPSFAECVENESQINNSSLNSTCSDDVEFNYPKKNITRQSLLSSTIHELREPMENDELAVVREKTEGETDMLILTSKQKYSINYLDISCSNLAIEECNAPQITFVDVPSNQTFSDHLNASHISTMDPLAQCGDIHHMSVDASFNTHMSVVQEAIYIQEPMDISNIDTNIESMDISCAENSSYVKHPLSEEKEYSTIFNEQTAEILTESNSNLKVQETEVKASSAMDPVEPKPTVPILHNLGYQIVDTQYKNDVIRSSENESNKKLPNKNVSNNEFDGMNSSEVENLQYYGRCDSDNSSLLKGIDLFGASENSNLHANQEYDICNSETISESKSVDPFPDKHDQSANESVLSVVGLPATVSSDKNDETFSGISEVFHDETKTSSAAHGNIALQVINDECESTSTETVLMKGVDLLLPVSSNDTAEITTNSSSCALTNLNVTQKVLHTSKISESQTISDERSIIQRTSLLSKSAEDVSFSFDGIENAKDKSTIVTSCKLEETSASESKVNDNAFHDKPTTNLSLVEHKSNSTDDNGSMPKCVEDLSTTYETNTCETKEEHNTSCKQEREEMKSNLAELNKTFEEYSVEAQLSNTEEKMLETIAISTHQKIDIEESEISLGKYSVFSGESLIATLEEKLSEAETLIKSMKHDPSENPDHVVKTQDEICHVVINKTMESHSLNVTEEICPLFSNTESTSNMSLSTFEVRSVDRTYEANTLFDKEKYDQKALSETQLLKSEHTHESNHTFEKDYVEVPLSIILNGADEVNKSIQTMASSMHKTIDAEESAIAEDLHTDSSGENLNVTLENKSQSEIRMEVVKTDLVAGSSQEVQDKTEICQFDDEIKESNSSGELNGCVSLPRKLECRRSIRSKRQATQVIPNPIILNEAEKSAEVVEDDVQVENKNSDLANQVDRLQNEVKRLLEDNLRKDKTVLSHALKKESSKELFTKYKHTMDAYENQLKKNSEDLSRLKEEYEKVVQHFNSSEMAFTDLFKKYEKAKNGIAVYVKNESILLDNLKYSEEAFAQLEIKYKATREQLERETRRAHGEMEQEREQYRQKIAKLQAIVKRLEIKASSLEVSIKQKVEECQALSALCDDITGKESI